MVVRSENAKTMTLIKRSVKWVWTGGAILAFGMIVLLWCHGYNAHTFPQAAFFNTRLGLVSAFGVLWSIAGGMVIKRLK